MTPMTIKYSKVLAGLELVVGALLCVVALQTSQMLQGILGVILLLLGILMLVNPMVRIEANEVQVRNLVGMTLKRFPVSSPADLRLDGKTLRHVPQDKRIINLGFGVDGADANALRAQLSTPST